MNDLSLSLRQRKLIHYLQQKNSVYTTGEELAGHLHVSARTIRNDINELNQSLTDTGVQITSKRSSGYLLESDDEQHLEKLSQSSNSFLSRDERVRHIAFRLCLSDTPINLYDLEDEMYISRTTLEHDLHALRRKYILPDPHIIFSRHRNHIQFEKNERKRRIILNHLFSENWNYNARGNAFFQYQYMDERIVNQIIHEVNFYMTKYNIMMEDVNMVTLDLAIAIMYYRITAGHELTELITDDYRDATAIHAANELLDSLEEKLNCRFSAIEREDIYRLISCGRLLDASLLNFASVTNFFEPSIIQLTDTYINYINVNYQIDFSKDEDFYITILQYFRYLSLPLHYFNRIDTHFDVARTKFLIEFEIAFAFQPFALEYYGFYLDYTEILYLAFCISGAMAHAKQASQKLKTVIMCHLNLPSSWELKHHIASRFGDYIDITALLPVYTKDSYDFSKVDLVVTTANKEITQSPNCKTLLISPFLTYKDQENLERLIQQEQLQHLYASSLPSLHDLLTNAFWHEQITNDDYFSVFELLANDFIQNGYVDSNYLTEVFRRESIFTFAFQPSIVLVYSTVPSTHSCLSVATYEHRIRWNTYKIRTVIMAAIRPEDKTLIFKLINELYSDRINPNDTRFIKTKTEFIDFYDNAEVYER